jgi:hypothetical protein
MRGFRASETEISFALNRLHPKEFRAHHRERIVLRCVINNDDLKGYITRQLRDRLKTIPQNGARIEGDDEDRNVRQGSLSYTDRRSRCTAAS